MTDARLSLADLIAPEETTTWLLCEVPGLVAPLTFSQIGGGHSNVTVRVQDSGGRRVLLRRPPADAQPGAHDVVREARLVQALAGTGVPVAGVLAVCRDVSVLGAPFTVSDWVEGTVVDSPAVVQHALGDPARRARAATDLVAGLVRLHAVDPKRAGIEDLVRPGSFLDRQLYRWSVIWGSTRTCELPLVDQLHARLAAAKPPEAHAGLVHGDYRLGNCLLNEDGSLAAVLDWELATVGETLVDVALLLNNWEQPGDPQPSAWMSAPPTRAGGFPDRPELVAQYVAATGRDLEALDYFRAFAWWRMAVIADGVKRRYESNGTGSVAVDMAHVRKRVTRLAQLADHHLTTYGA